MIHGTDTARVLGNSDSADSKHPGDAPDVAARPSESAAQLNREAAAAAREGRLDEAIGLYQRLLEVRPDFPEAYNNLGIVYGRKGRSEESIGSFSQALVLKPDYPEAHNNLAIALTRLGRGEEALAHLDAALRLKPEYPEAHNNRGNTLRGMARLDEAVASYRRALAFKPDYPEANNNLGNALAEQERLDDAVQSYREALRLNPRYAEAHNNLGNSLARLGRHDEAEGSYRKALRYNPDYPEAHNNLGNALAEKGCLAEAAACYRQALRLNADYAEAYNNLGITLLKQGKPGEADAAYQDAVRLKPDYADAHLNRALAWLQTGHFEQGWREYEWRWRVRGVSRPKFKVPAWNGEPLGGKTVLLYAEQGLGDTLQFIRYAALVKRRGGVVAFECQRVLAPLLARTAGIDLLVPKGTALPEFQTHCALLSLPRVLRTTLGNAPCEVPYLYADPRLVADWRHRLDRLRGFRIGINWQGNTQYKGDRHRSIPLKAFAPLADVHGVRLISLQKHRGAEQLQDVADRFPVADLGGELDEAAGAFMDTAAVIMNLDLVITSDTAMAHLAGGLGVPVWVPLSWSPDWRWMDERADSPWYSTMRLFRQTEPSEWDDVFTRMAEEIRGRASSESHARPIPVKVSLGELIDRLLTLEAREADAGESHDDEELAELRAAYARFVAPSPELEQAVSELRSAHAAVGGLEKEIRACTQRDEFGPRFAELSRSLFRQEDVRRVLKLKIDELLWC